MIVTEFVDEEQELKADLIRSLGQVHDIRFLRGQLAMVREFTDEDDIYELTPEEERLIDAAERRLAMGRGMTGDEFQKDIETWLNQQRKRSG